MAPPPSSRGMIVALAPPKPLVSYGAGSFPALIASATIFAPFIAGMPNGPAAPPVKNDGTAIEMASLAKAIPPDNVIADTAAKPTAPLINLLFIKTSLILIFFCSVSSPRLIGVSTVKDPTIRLNEKLLVKSRL